MAVPAALDDLVARRATGRVTLPAHISSSGPAITYDPADRADRAGERGARVVREFAGLSVVDVVVSGDDDLLALGSFEGIAMLSVVQAVARVEPAGRG